MASNFYGTKIITLDRKIKDGHKMKLSALKGIPDYNRFMGGIGHYSRLRSTIPTILGRLEIAFVNTYVISKLWSVNDRTETVLEFRRK